jgi:hypothetical protein
VCRFAIEITASYFALERGVERKKETERKKKEVGKKTPKTKEKERRDAAFSPLSLPSAFANSSAAVDVPAFEEVDTQREKENEKGVREREKEKGVRERERQRLSVFFFSSPRGNKARF